MSLLQDDAERCRRARAAQRPARVTAPLVAGLGFVLTVVLGGMLIGLGTALLTTLALVATVVAGFLARRTLGSLAVGAGLLVVRPYAPGDIVRVYVVSLRRVIDAEVVRVGPANTTLRYGDRSLVLPNGAMLRPPPETSMQA